MTDFSRLLTTLSTGGVDFILVSGVAATVHGASRLTYDVDIVYSRSPSNLNRLMNSLAPFSPYLRGAPPDLPFRWNVKTLEQGLNFTLTTTCGELDLLGEITGGGNYDHLLAHRFDIEVFGVVLKCLKLDWLIHVKRAAGRPKDFESIAELESIRDERPSD